MIPRIARSSVPKAEKGFHIALEDIQPKKAFIVYNGSDRYQKSDQIEVISLRELSQELQTIFS